MWNIYSDKFIYRFWNIAMWVDKEMEKPTYVHSVQGGDESKLTSETLWESLKAVKEKHAHKVDADMFYLNAGITAALGVIEEIDKNI